MRRVWTSLVALALSVGIAAEARGQIELSSRRPRFLAADSPAGAVVDASGAAVLQRRVSLELAGVTMEAALREIARQAELELMFTGAVLPAGRSVTLRASDITVAAALTEVLLNSGIDVLLLPSGQMGLVRRPPPEPRPAQTGAVAGRVTDAKTGRALEGAEVALEGTRWRTNTEETGFYRLDDVAPGSYTLSARRIGYARQRRTVAVVEAQELVVDVALSPVPTQLEDVVTTATGEQRLLELGHVVGRINADSLVKEAPVSTVAELLMARVPGVLVQPQQGTVGGEVKLRIRGANSVLLGAEPIVIVDGIRYASSPRPASNPNYAFGPFAGAGGNEGTSRLNDLNPNDIELIEVVKGPSAATLYGTDAANGVIVVTTKQGRPGSTRWDGYTRASLSEIPAYHYPESYWGWSSTTAGSCVLLHVAAGRCVQDSVTALPNPLNDPALTIFGQKPRWEYGASTSGGSQALQYYFSGDVEHATGPVRLPLALRDEIAARRGVRELPEEELEPNAFRKLNLRGTVRVGMGPRADVRVTAGYTQNMTRTLVALNPYSASAGVPFTDPLGQYWRSFNSPENAFALTSTERLSRFVGSASGTWQPWTWLQLRGTVGLDFANSGRYSFARPDPARLTDAQGAVGDARTQQRATSADLGATASVRLGRLSSRTSIGAQYVRDLFDALAADGRGLPPGGSSVGEASAVTTRQSYDARVTLGSYVEQVLGLNDRLFVTGALRIDGASGFGRDYDVAVYPKASASWLVSEEPLLPRIPGLDQLRVRYAYGVSGQQARQAWQRPGLRAERTLVDGVPGTGVRIPTIGNPDLRPERVREHEVGVDAAWLRGRVRLDLTWSSRRTLDQLVSLPLAPGFGTIQENLGRVDGHGFEAQVTVRPLTTRLLDWSVTARHAWHTNTLVDLGGNAPSLGSMGALIEGAGWAAGYPFPARFSRPILGYADANGNGILELGEVQLGDAFVYVGRVTPPRAQTLSTTLGLFQQRLRLSAVLERQAGFVQLNSRLQRCQRTHHCRAAVDPTTPLADQAVAVAIEAAGSTFAPVAPGDFTRLREVAAVLDLPSRLIRAARLRRASLSISVRNLALWTAYDGGDPESAEGVQGAGIPQARTWTLRFDAGF